MIKLLMLTFELKYMLLKLESMKKINNTLKLSFSKLCVLPPVPLAMLLYHALARRNNDIMMTKV